MDEKSPAEVSKKHRELAVVPDDTEDLAGDKDAQEDTSAANAESPSVPLAPTHPVRTSRFKAFLRHKPLVVIAIIVLLLAVVALIPRTRYLIIGAFWKQNYAVTVLDSQTRQPVTKAIVSLGGQSVTTDNHGDATIRAQVGYRTIEVSKKYYAGTTETILVPIFVKGRVAYTLKATGRQVPITVFNTITNKPVENALIKTSDAEAYTAGNGQATLVLSPNDSSVAATISADGYNLETSNVMVTTQTVSQNSYRLTPTGKIYFLSDLSGKIDVVKTNLDGTDRQTVLAGTGFEDTDGTVLLASRDWKYLMLDSIRTAGGSPELSLIETTNNDKVVSVDQSNSQFQLVGWENDYFVYSASQNSYPIWQPGGSSIESYNANSGKSITLDSTNATGTSAADAQFQTFVPSNVVEFNNQIIYAKTWYEGIGYLNVPGQQNTLNSIAPDGTGKKIITSLDAGNSYFGGLETRSPATLTVQVENNNSTQTSYYDYGLDGSFNLDTSPQAASQYQQVYPTYLLSPVGDETFWSTPEDGKNGLYVGDQNGANAKQIETLSSFAAYGWYTDNYLLVSENGSELYVMPASGGTPLKITDYHKAEQSYAGYGGGYGGL
jgi:hypothetical protein